jgi:hypothetical protein
VNLFCSFRNFPKIYLINFVFYRITASLVFFFVLTGRAFADPILGDAGAAWSTADATQVNPANGAFLDRTQGTGSLELLRNESLYIRYPGGDPVIERKSGLGGLASTVPPSGVLKLGPNFALGGYIIPPGITVDVDVNKLPVFILSQTQLIDIKVKGTADFLGGFTTSYRFGDMLSLGIGGNLRTISFVANLQPSGTGTNLATARGKISDMNGLFGARLDLVPGKFGVGLGVTVFQVHEESIDLETDPSLPLPTDAAPSGTNQTVPMSQIVAGYYADLGRLKILGDVRYTRAIQGVEVFSVAELKPKTKEVHDTVGVSGGGVLQFSERLNGLAGFRYEPATVGSGSRSTNDQEGTAGFGPIELAEVFVGLKSLTPYTQYAAGFQLMLLPKSLPKSDRVGRGSPSRYYTLTIHGGIGYREATLGIDENGEQPAAYYQKKIFIPGGLTIKL